MSPKEQRWSSRIVEGARLAAVAVLVACGGQGDAAAGDGGDRDDPTTSGESATAAATRTATEPGVASTWPRYGGDLGQTRFSRLDALGPGNVDSLEVAWTYRSGFTGIFEATPVVTGDGLYVSTPTVDGRQRVARLDPATGEPTWETTITVEGHRPEPTSANRGVAVADGRAFVGTLDARIVALDAATGDVLWETRTADPGRGYQHKQAPVVHDGVVYTGVSGGPLGIRGFLKALDAASGEELWTWHSIPSPAEGGWWGGWTDTFPGTDIPLPRDLERERADSARYADAWRRGGGSVWMTPSLDPERGLVYLGVGNPAPELRGDVRPGDNRWTVSVCAVRTEDGTTAWCDQLLPHDQWGYEPASSPFLFEAERDGETIPAVGHFSKMGIFYAWDRRSGERLVQSDPYVPHRNFLARPTADGVTIAPGLYGGTEWSPAAYSPETGLAYAVNLHAPGRYYVRGDGSVGFDLSGEERWGSVVGLNPATGDVAWEDRTERPMVGGALVTAGGLLFAGELGGALTAWDARTGERLWSGATPAGCASAPATYRAAGRQLVVVACGGHFFGGGRGDALVAFGLPSEGVREE